MQIELRPLRDEDLPEVKKLADSLHDLASDRISIHWLFSTFFQGTSFVATKGQEICGFIYGFVNQSSPSEAFIYLLGVSPDSQRCGIGRRLLGQFAEAAAAKGCSAITLTTTSDNFGALQFYKQMGFEEPAPFLKAGQERVRLRKGV